MARYHREQLNIPVIGLTGSNGKTTTKELIHAVLSQKFNVLATQGNLNNHIGVPLTLLRMNASTEIALIEMGANHRGEIAFLSEIARPTLGYITNFGKAHLEGFGGVEGLFLEKVNSTPSSEKQREKQLLMGMMKSSYSKARDWIKLFLALNKTRLCRCTIYK